MNAATRKRARSFFLSRMRSASEAHETRERTGSFKKKYVIAIYVHFASCGLVPPALKTAVRWNRIGNASVVPSGSWMRCHDRRRSTLHMNKHIGSRNERCSFPQRNRYTTFRGILEKSRKSLNFIKSCRWRLQRIVSIPLDFRQVSQDFFVHAC